MSSDQSSTASAPSTTYTGNRISDAQYQKYVEQDLAYHKASIPLSDLPSCTDCFDKWAQCFALGPQLKAVYRYGGMRDCKEKLDDFKFCLTLKSMSQEEKYEAWIERKAQKSASARLSNASSENVWNIRTDPLEKPRSKTQVTATIV